MIQLGNTTITTLVTGPWNTGLTNVYNPPSVTMSTSANAWYAFTLPTPFLYTGGNLIFEMSNAGNATSGITINQFTAPYLGLMYGSTGGTTGTADAATAVFGFDMIPAAPPDNAGVDSLITPAMDGMFCSGDQLVTVRVRNLGMNRIDSVKVNWSVGGVLQPQVNLVTTIDSIAADPNNFAIVPLGTANFPYNLPTAVKAWTSLPNGVPDTKPSDDTLTVSITALRQGVNINTLPTDTAICIGATITLDADTQPAHPVYMWSTGAVTQSIQTNSAGTYTVVFQNLDDCSDTATVQVTVIPDAAAYLAANDNGGGSYTFTLVAPQNIATCTWDFGDGSPIETGLGPKNHTYTHVETDTVTVIVSNECGSHQLNYTVLQTKTGVDNVSALQKSLSLYPNPGKDKVTLGATKGEIHISRVEVYDLTGKRVFISDVTGDKLDMDISQLAQGIYHVAITTNKGTATKKLEIVR
jgi:hypothetical protein